MATTIGTSDPDDRLRPIRRLPRRAATWIAALAGLAVVGLVVNLVVAVVGDSDGDHPVARRPGAGPGFTPIPPTDSTVDDFVGTDGTAPGAVPDSDLAWDVDGPLAMADGVLRSDGPSSAALPLPPGDRLLQTVVVSPGAGWTIAFAYDGPGDFWGVRIGPRNSALVHVEGGETEVVADEPLLTQRWVETVVTWRDGQVSIRSGGSLLWTGPGDRIGPADRMALVAAGATEGSVDSVALRAL